MKRKSATMYDKLFSGINLPIKPAVAATGATIALIEEAEVSEETSESFFGGYAEHSILDDLGIAPAGEFVEEDARK